MTGEDVCVGVCHANDLWCVFIDVVYTCLQASNFCFSALSGSFCFITIPLLFL